LSVNLCNNLVVFFVRVEWMEWDWDWDGDWDGDWYWNSKSLLEEVVGYSEWRRRFSWVGAEGENDDVGVRKVEEVE